MIVPAWINPSFRVIEDGTTYEWAHINALANKLAPELQQGSRAAVTAHSVPTLVEALVAAQRSGVELALLRQASPRPAGAAVQIEKGGRLVRLGPGAQGRSPHFAVLIPTSGTTGEPKLVRQDFTRLIGRLRGNHRPDSRWLLTYEPTAFGGVQAILAVVAAGATMIAAPGAGPADLARLALEHQVTHISATPGVWRRLLQKFGDAVPPLRAVTLGGDISDQPLLDRLAQRFPEARQYQIYASSEAGVVFTVTDGQAGFPVDWLESGVDDVMLRVRNGGLEIQTPRVMLNYAGGEARPFASDGWLISGDRIERRGARALFTGRAEAMIPNGGTKISPARIEIALLSVPGVGEVLVKMVGAPGPAAELVAAVVLDPGSVAADMQERLRRYVEENLAPAERPRTFEFVDQIPLAPSGKKMRVPFF